MPDDFFAIDGRVVPAAQATISVLDLGFLRGVGAFETLRTYGGHPHAVAEHLARLWQAAAIYGIAPCFSEGDLRRTIAQIIAKSGHPDVRVNLVVSPGDHTAGVFGAARPRWVVIARDVHAPSAADYAQGVAVVTAPGTRLLPQIKSTSYLSGIVPMQAAAKTGAHEALYVDIDGHVTEGVTSNVLCLHGMTVTTPVAHCLAGLTKAGLRPLAIAAGLTWREAPLTPAELLAADEVWITSAVRELLPVTRVDGQPIADGQVGPWAKRLGADYRQGCIASALADAQRFQKQQQAQQ